MESSQSKNSRILYDPIHGHIEFDLPLWQFIDNPVYQRLRNLKQLGTTNYVFPGATHTRFEHCLGVGNLSRKYLRHLQKKQPELDINNQDINNVTLAGMMHDLGHGPFSHIFDTDVVPALGIQDWTHENASVKLFEYMIDEYNLDIEQSNIKRISDMITGDGKGFMYQIVNNKLNQIDVDKFDYIERDCHYLGFREFPFDTKRLMKRSKIIDDIICYDEKVVHSVYSLFQSRFSLFQQCYSHRVGQAVGLMLRDALVLAEPILHLKEIISDPSQYYKLDDSLIPLILYSNDPRLDRSKEILNNIQLRKIYKQAGELIVSSNTPIDNITAETIVGYNNLGTNLHPSDIIVKKFKLTYGNPADQVYFYKDNERFLIPREKVSTVIPANYCDRYVRIFVKSSDKLEAAKKAFESFCKRET